MPSFLNQSLRAFDLHSPAKSVLRAWMVFLPKVLKPEIISGTVAAASDLVQMPVAMVNRDLL